MAVAVRAPHECLTAQFALEIPRRQMGPHVVLNVAQLMSDQPTDVALQLLLSSAVFFCLGEEADDVRVDSVMQIFFCFLFFLFR